MTRRPDAGFVATELAAGVALLVLPVAVLVLTFPRWSERQTTARVIAREVARRAARDAVCDRASARHRVDLACSDGTALAPGSDVEARVTVAMPAVEVPGVGAVSGWSWTASHREPVDRYASAR